MRKFEKLLCDGPNRSEAGNPAFRCAFCRPGIGTLRDRWDDFRRKRETREGAREVTAQSLLLSYRAGAGGSLWLLECTRRQSTATLGAQATRALERAMLLVSRELPALVDVQRRQAKWSISRISSQGELVLEGESFGLSMCLAAAAQCLGLSSSPTVAATAGVDDDGALFEVSGLREKLSVLNEWALGIGEVIVAANQVDLARAVTEELGARWQIAPARTVADAINIAFPDVWGLLKNRWVEPTTAATVAGDLFRLARDGSNHVLSWSGIAAAAEQLIARVPEQSIASKEARFAQLVALRHEGHDALLALDEDLLNAMRRPLRLRCLAHIVQSHADCAETFEPAIGQAVDALIPTNSTDDSVDDLWLLGAVGRLLAAFFRYEAAESALRRAVLGWFELGSAPEASHALCELLRVVAVANGRSAFLTLVGDYATPFLNDPRVAAVSRGFVHCALGRGYALLDDATAAERHLADEACEWSLLPDHLRATRLRWLLKVRRRQGASLEPYDGQLAQIVRRFPKLQFAAALVELDDAQHDDTGMASSLRVLRECASRDYRRFAAAYGAELGTRISREFRY